MPGRRDKAVRIGDNVETVPLTEDDALEAWSALSAEGYDATVVDVDPPE